MYLMLIASIMPCVSDIWYKCSKLDKIKWQISVEIYSGLEQKKGGGGGGDFAIIVLLSVQYPDICKKHFVWHTVNYNLCPSIFSSEPLIFRSTGMLYIFT